MRRMLVLAAAALTLAAAPAAPAKQVEKVQVCGPEGCATVDDENARMTIIDGGPPRTPPTEAPYWEVRVTMVVAAEETGGAAERHAWSFAAVPSKDAARAEDGTWMQPPREAITLVKEYSKGIEPYPASRMLGWAPPREQPAPAPAASDADSPLWPEGVIVAILALGAAVAVRARAAARTARRASSRPGPAAP
jgi:hypothetical protein